MREGFEIEEGKRREDIGKKGLEEERSEEAGRMKGGRGVDEDWLEDEWMKGGRGAEEERSEEERVEEDVWKVTEEGNRRVKGGVYKEEVELEEEETQEGDGSWSRK